MSNLPDGMNWLAYESAYGTDPVADQLDTARVAHALAKLAYALGFDTIGDAAHDAVSDAMANDGIDSDDFDHGRTVMDGDTATVDAALKLLAADWAVVQRRAARLAA